jgi:uncharacterized protein YndB with AHSA1/START domain
MSTETTKATNLAKGKFITTIASNIVIAKAPEQVFEYVTTAGNWPQWHPSSLNVIGAIDHSGEVGEEITEQFRVAGRRGEVVWTVRERHYPVQWVIEGRIKNSLSGGVVKYELTPTSENNGSTLFKREFSYDMPNLLYHIINKLLLQRRVQHESDEALHRLKEKLE